MRALLLGAGLLAAPLMAQGSPAEAVALVLDDWHEAAAKADEARYFGHLTEDAVFLGTDATERWVKPAFQKWAHPFFARGRAWAFKATRRGITVAPDRRVAWFDEDLATPNLGPCRGSGVLVKVGSRWQIAQYNLSVPIPNALMDSVKQQIDKHLKP